MGKRSRLSCFKKWQKLIAPPGANGADDLDEPVAKRAKLDHLELDTTSALGGAGNDQYDIYSAKIAAETVEAVDLPNVHGVSVGEEHEV